MTCLFQVRARRKSVAQTHSAEVRRPRAAAVSHALAAEIMNIFVSER